VSEPTIEPADTALLRDCAKGVEAYCFLGLNLRHTAARLRALADQMEQIEQGEPRRGNARFCQRCLCELPNHSTSCEKATALAREVRVWRWLHWDQPDAPWGCRCGGANGHAITECPVCGAKRPARDVPLDLLPSAPPAPHP
jgi:hypothetical protein